MNNNNTASSDRSVAKSLSKEGQARLEYSDRIKKAWEQADGDLYRTERGLPARESK